MLDISSISLITTCMNRNSFLKKALPSWRGFPFKEIIIVDWSSDKPLNEDINIEKNMIVVRVNDEQYFNPSTARNTGERFSSGDFLLFVDSDIIFDKFFLKDYSIRTGENFYSGSKKIDTHIYGDVLVSKTDFNEINGYNEHIKCYSYEDGDFYKRLKDRGLRKENFLEGAFVHMDHPDSDRTKYFEIRKKSLVDDMVFAREIASERYWDCRFTREEKVVQVYRGY